MTIQGMRDDDDKQNSVRDANRRSSIETNTGPILYTREGERKRGYGLR